MKTGFYAVALAAGLAACLTSDAGEGFDKNRLAVLHRTTKGFVDRSQHAGFVTLLAHKGKIVDFQAYGLRDAEKKLPIERDTIFRIYSMSKIITSVATLILWEEGKFNLQDSSGELSS